MVVEDDFADLPGCKATFMDEVTDNVATRQFLLFPGVDIYGRDVRPDGV